MNAAVVALREIRERAGLSVDDAAAVAGVSPAWLQRVEAGEASMTHGMAGKISHALVDHLDGVTR